MKTTKTCMKTRKTNKKKAHENKKNHINIVDALLLHDSKQINMNGFENLQVLPKFFVEMFLSPTRLTAPAPKIS